MQVTEVFQLFLKKWVPAGSAGSAGSLFSQFSPFSPQRTVFGWLALYALVFSWSVAGGNFALDAALALLALYGLIRRPPLPWAPLARIDRRVVAVAASFVLAAAVAAAFAYRPSAAGQRLWFLVYCLLPLPLGMAFVTEPRQRVLLFRLALVSLLVAALVSIGQWYWHGFGADQRVTGPTGTWLISSVHLEMAMPFLLVFAAEPGRLPPLQRAALAVLLLLCGIALLVVNSRAAWLAVAVAFALYFVLRLRRLSAKALVALALLLVLALGFLASQPLLVNRLRSITDLNYHNNSERILMWKGAWNMFRDHPLLGVGTGNYPDLYRNRYILPEAYDRRHSHAHNNYLQYFAETGIIGGSLFLAMFAYLLRHYLGRYRRDDDLTALGVFLAICAFAVHGLMDWNYGMFPSLAQTLWFLVGVTWRELPGQTDGPAGIAAEAESAGTAGNAGGL